MQPSDSDSDPVARPLPPRVGFVGLGRMGAPIARNLLRAGIALRVADPVPAAVAALAADGAAAAASPRAAAEAADIVFSCLPGPAEVERAALGADGILAGARPGAVYVDLSSGSPSVIRRVHAAFAERGVGVLDAPISGGVGAAERGTLSMMVGGAERDFEAVRPALRLVGDKIRRTGEIGSGTVAKLVHNLVYIATRGVVAEALTLGVKAGVDAGTLLEVLREGAFGQGLMLSHFLPEMAFRGRYEPVRFAMRLARKDVGLATALARELDVPMDLAALTEQNLVAALARGWGDRDYGLQFVLQEERAGVRVRHPRTPDEK